MSNKPNRFSPEVRERAIRMVQDQRGEYAPLWAANRANCTEDRLRPPKPFTNGSVNKRVMLACEMAPRAKSVIASKP